MPVPNLTMTLLSGTYAVCRLHPDTSIPVWALSGAFFSVTKTADEVSVVCEQSLVPAGTQAETDWRILKVEGPLDFSLTGILANISGALADAGVSIFALSTYDTDYILVREKAIEATFGALRNAGYRIRVEAD